MLISLASLAIALPIRRELGALIDELAPALLVRRKSKRVKRYILVKVVCNDKANIVQFIKEFEKRLLRLVGELEKLECDVTVASISRASNRMIVRVRGDYRCFKRALVALSIQHIVFGDCIAIPIRTSGLISRLRKLLY